MITNGENSHYLALKSIPTAADIHVQSEVYLDYGMEYHQTMMEIFTVWVVFIHLAQITHLETRKIVQQ